MIGNDLKRFWKEGTVTEYENVLAFAWREEERII
jgi:hypothetical protein